MGSFILVSEKYLDLGRGDHEGAVDALVALEHVLREEAAGAQLGDAQCQRADAGGETDCVENVGVRVTPQRSFNEERPSS